MRLESCVSIIIPHLDNLNEIIDPSEKEYSEKLNKFLVMEHHKYNLSIPGGKVEINEKPKEAAIRELYEEVGLMVKKKHLKLINYNICYDKIEDFTYHLYTYYLNKYLNEKDIFNKEPEKHPNIFFESIYELEKMRIKKSKSLKILLKNQRILTQEYLNEIL